MRVAEQVFEKSRGLPGPAQQSVLELVEKLAGENEASRSIFPGKKVRLPLIDSQEPGVLNRTNADIEELLA